MVRYQHGSLLVSGWCFLFVVRRGRTWSHAWTEDVAVWISNAATSSALRGEESSQMAQQMVPFSTIV